MALIDKLNAIGDAVRSKTGGVEKLTLDGMVTAINSISGGGSESPTWLENVIFYDYDGTILHSYSKDDFLALTTLPDLPTQPGLTCQGWNYDITNAKTYVEKYGKLDVGATYITDDGKTRLYIKIVAEGRMDVPLFFSQTVDNGVTIDWGDGSDTQTVSGTGNRNTSHAYANIGDYCITLTVSSDCTLGLGKDVFTTSGSTGSCGVMGCGDENNRITAYCNMLQKVEIGSNIPSIGYMAFYYCFSLSSIVIPESVTSIEKYAFNYCYSMAFYDFSNHTSVPTLSNTNAFSSIPSDCKIIVPDSLYDTWIAETNWSRYAYNIIKKSDWNAL